MLRRGACPQRDAGMESVSGGFSTTATPHGRLYATDLALANPDPVGLAPAPPPRGIQGAGWEPLRRTKPHSSALSCFLLLSTTQSLRGILLLRPTAGSTAQTKAQDLGSGHMSSCFQLSALSTGGSVLPFLSHPGL